MLFFGNHDRPATKLGECAAHPGYCGVEEGNEPWIKTVKQHFEASTSMENRTEITWFSVTLTYRAHKFWFDDTMEILVYLFIFCYVNKMHFCLFKSVLNGSSTKFSHLNSFMPLRRCIQDTPDLALQKRQIEIFRSTQQKRWHCLLLRPQRRLVMSKPGKYVFCDSYES